MKLASREMAMLDLYCGLKTVMNEEEKSTTNEA
jgi:hypothetical protein